MHRSLVFLFGVVVAGAGVSLGACADDAGVKAAAGSVGSVAASSSAGTTSGGGGAGGAADGGGMCNEPPPPSPTQPQQIGCYEDVMASGWVQVPCLCDLWLENTTFSPATATIELTVTPPTPAPTLTGTLDVEIAFDDPDASLYATWTQQAGNGDAFTVTSEGGTTTVRMGESAVSLGHVPIAACTTRKAVATVSGSYSATLTMHPVLDEGAVFATTDGSCFNPPHP